MEHFRSLTADMGESGLKRLIDTPWRKLAFKRNAMEKRPFKRNAIVKSAVERDATGEKERTVCFRLPPGSAALLRKFPGFEGSQNG